MIAGLTASQGVIFEALTNAGIAGGRISDAPSDDVTFPHVEIGETIATSMPLSGYAEGSDEIAMVIVHSRARGAKELKDILGTVRLALDGQEFNWQDRTSVICYVLDETVQRDPDGKTRRGVVRVNVIHMGAKEG